MDCSPPGTSVHRISQTEYWNGLPFPLPGDLPDPGIKPVSTVSPALAGEFVTAKLPGKLNVITGVSKCGRGRQKRHALGERLHHLSKMEGSMEPRNASDSWNLEKAKRTSSLLEPLEKEFTPGRSVLDF